MYTTLIQNAKEKLKYKYLLKEGFVNKNYEPQRCFYCNSTLLEDCNADRTDYIVLSYARQIFLYKGNFSASLQKFLIRQIYCKCPQWCRKHNRKYCDGKHDIPTGKPKG